MMEKSAHDTPAVLYSFHIDADGRATPLDTDTWTPPPDGLIWLHLNASHAGAKTLLKDRLRIDPLVVKSLLTYDARPRVEEFGRNMLMILRGIQYHAGPKPEDLVSVRLWVSDNLIVTLRHRKSQAMSDIAARIKTGTGPRRIGDFIAHIIDELHDGIDPAIRELIDSIDSLEERALEEPSSDMHYDIARVRKQAIMFRRHLAPQRDVIWRLLNSRQGWMTESDKWYMQDNYNRVTRHLEDLESTRERAQIVQDDLNNAQSARINRNLYILSMITVIFMPLSFLTGLLGINFDGIPGAHHPHGFFIFCALLLAIVAAEAVYFRKKWFD